MPTTPAAAPLRGRLKLRQLVVLDALADSPTLRRAAGVARMTQPAATRLIAELEATLGVKLFERSRQGMSATPFGRAMIQHARRVLTDLDHAGREIEALVNGERGIVHVGTFVSAAAALLPACILAVKRRSPAVSIRVQQATQDVLVDALRRNELDLMIGRVIDSGDVDDLDLEVLHPESFRIVAGAANPLARARRLRWKDLIDEPWILPPPPGPLRARLNGVFAAEAGRLPTNVVESLSTLTNIALLQDGGFLAVMPGDAAREFGRHGIVRTLDVPVPELLGPLALITRKGPVRSQVVGLFRDTVRQVAAGKAFAGRRASRVTGYVTTW